MPFNPLQFIDENDLYYRTGRASDVMLRSGRNHEVDVDQVVVPMTPALADLKAKLIEDNFANRELLLPASTVKNHWNDFVQRLGHGTSIPQINRQSSML